MPAADSLSSGRTEAITGADNATAEWPMLATQRSLTECSFTVRFDRGCAADLSDPRRLLIIEILEGQKSKKANRIRLAFTWKHILATRFWKHKLAKWQSYGPKDNAGFRLFRFWWAVLGSNQ